MHGLQHFIATSVGSWGYVAIFGLMALESACIPIPSEVTMPVGGFLASSATASSGRLDLLLVGLMGVLGNLVGSWVAYGVGATGGRAFVLRFGRYVRLNPHHLDRAEAWFADHGEGAVFWSRLLPVVRTFISLPAGVGRMKLGRFSVYTVLGCLPWSYGLAVGGYFLGKNWDKLASNIEAASIVVAVLIVAAIVALVLRARRRAKSPAESAQDRPLGRPSD
jgi:membrane protein DedA with SNARE-associated domain